MTNLLRAVGKELHLAGGISSSCESDLFAVALLVEGVGNVVAGEIGTVEGLNG